MSTGSAFGDIPDVPTLENRFHFIENEKTRQNITVCFQYVIFLTVANETYNERGTIELSIYRDQIVHTASIIETCLHYCLMRLGELGKVDLQKLDAEWKPHSLTPIHTISETKKVVWGYKERSIKALAPNATSEAINRAAKEAGILDEVLFKKAETIRETRNKIHLIGKEEEDLYPNADQIEELFTATNEILEIIEEKLR